MVDKIFYEKNISRERALTLSYEKHFPKIISQ